MLRLATAFVLALSAAASASAQEVTVDVSESEEYGRFLTSGGRPVYVFTGDTPGDGATAPVVTCAEECLDAWPLLWVDGAPEAGEGVDAALLGTAGHEGGTVATYAGWPLYQFARDAEGAPPSGQEAEGFGGAWFLIAPDGRRIEGEGV